MRNRPGSPAAPPPLVDQTAELGKEFGDPVNLVEDHEPVLVVTQKQARFREPGPVGSRLKVQVERIGGARDLMGQSRLAYLSRAEQRRGRLAGKRPPDIFQGFSWYHPCKITSIPAICKDNRQTYSPPVRLRGARRRGPAR